jgi:hypothetical protein
LPETIGDGDAPARDDAGRVIALPWRPPLLGEPPERSPAFVLEFPTARVRRGEPPETGGSTPPRLAV